ncbi:MAG: hypothetical protein ACYDD1_04940 [Caulobacteraceae bacterium]
MPQDDVLSDEQAIDFLISAPEAEPEPVSAEPAAEAAPEPEVQPTESEAEPTAEEGDAPVDPASEAPEAATPEAAPAPSIEAPHFWAADKKALFAQAPPELQSVILEQDKASQREVTRAQQEAAEARKLADEARSKAQTETGSLSTLRARVDELLPAAETTFSTKWKDWLAATPEQLVAYATSNPDDYIRGKAAFDAEFSQLQQQRAVKQELDQQAQAQQDTERKARVAREVERLRELAPDLADPKEAPGRFAKLAEFAKTRGVTPEQFRNASAAELAFANDAMKYHELVAASRKPPVRAAAPASPQAKPAAAPVTAPKTTASALLAKGAKSGSLSDDDAIALLLSQT